VARLIQRELAKRLNPMAARFLSSPKTGGINAMIVDSIALPEQCAGRMSIASAFD